FSIDAGPGVQSRARFSSYRGAATFQDHHRTQRGLVPAITPCMSASAGEVARPTLRVRGLLERAEPILITRGRAVADYREAFVGIDVAKLKNAIAIAEAGREKSVHRSVRLATG